MTFEFFVVRFWKLHSCAFLCHCPSSVHDCLVKIMYSGYFELDFTLVGCSVVCVVHIKLIFIVALSFKSLPLSLENDE